MAKWFRKCRTVLYFDHNYIYVGVGKEMGANVLVDLVVFTELEVIKKLQT